VEEAEQRETYATTHCHGTERIVRSLDAGVHMIEHATFVSRRAPASNRSSSPGSDRRAAVGMS
jgi:imidazolonepropionase-like amidohydrolase